MNMASRKKYVLGEVAEDSYTFENGRNTQITESKKHSNFPLNTFQTGKETGMSKHMIESGIRTDINSKSSEPNI